MREPDALRAEIGVSAESVNRVLEACDQATAVPLEKLGAGHISDDARFSLHVLAGGTNAGGASPLTS